MNWEIDKRLTAGLVLSALIALSINLLAFTSIRNLIEENRWVDHTHEVIEKSQVLLVRIINVDISSRSHLITGEDRFLELYHANAPFVRNDLRALRNLTVDRETQQTRIKSIEPMAQEFLRFAEDHIQKRKIKSLDDQSILLILSQQKRLVDNLRQTIGKLSAEERKLLVIRSANVKRRALQTNFLIVAGSIVSVLLLTLGMIFLNREMSRRKHAEESLRIAEERVRLAVLGGKIGTWHMDLKNRTVNWSDQFREMCEIDESTAPSVEAFVNALHPDDREAAATRSKSVLSGEAEVTSTNSEYRVLLQDGSTRWINTAGMIYRDEKGVALRMEGIAQDITERKNAENAIRQLNAKLEQQIVQVNELNEELEAFSYSVSHDLRAPLRHINGFVQLLKKDSESQLSEKSSRYLSVISGAATTMGVLIDDLLKLSRTTRIAINKQPVNLQGMVTNIVQQLNSDVADRKIEWQIGNMPTVYADPNLIRIVLNNLISNAVKYTRPRQVAEIEISSTNDDLNSVISIRDNGVGFEMKYADKLFGAFQRLHRAEEFEGTGVGLATVRRIISRHHGKVWAESEPGKGSTFSFSLPKGAENAI